MKLAPFFPLFTLICSFHSHLTPQNKATDRNRISGRKLSLKVKSVGEFFSDRELAETENGRGISKIVSAIESACAEIALEVKLANISSQGRAHDQKSSFNFSGEKQKTLDIMANDILKKCCRDCGEINLIASEEEIEPIIGTETGRYIAVFDPLDGSSNIDASIPTGTIFGIYRKDCDLSDGENILQPGSKMILGGYALYGASTTLVISLGNGTHSFVLNSEDGKFYLSRNNIKIPRWGKSYSLNEARASDWPEGLRKYISDLKSGRGESKIHYDLIYICSFVADVHHVLFHGGIASNPRSHLRLIYESNPMSFVVEQAGGKSSTGKASILSEVPSHVHQRIPTFIGSAGDILELEKYGKLYGGVQQLGNKKYDQ